MAKGVGQSGARSEGAPLYDPVLSGEVQLLFALLDRRAGEDSIAAIIEGGIDWEYFGWLVSRERAVPAVKRRLIGLPAELVPEPVQAALQRLAIVTDFRMSRLEGRLDETLGALRAAGIDVIMLKGAALASTVYRTFNSRLMGDLDLLIRPEDGEEAWRVVRGVRWRCDYGAEFDHFYSGMQHFPPLTDEDGTDLGLDLHTALFARHHPFELSVQSLWDAAVPVPTRGEGVYTLGPAHQALHLCIHFAWSHMMRSASWRTCSDLSALYGAGQLDWEELAELAVATRSSTVVYWTLRLARELIGLEVPEPVLERLAPAGPKVFTRLLDRHYLSHLAPDPVSCPSTRLAAMMWEWGIRPGSSGHGESRPWARDTLFREAERAAAAGAQVGAGVDGEVGTEGGGEPGGEAGVEPGAGTGVEPGRKAGAESGRESGKESGARSGKESGAGSGTERDVAVERVIGGDSEGAGYWKLLTHLGQLREWGRYLALLSGFRIGDPTQAESRRRAKVSRRGRG